MQDTLQAIITVLTLINPAICAATFLRIEAARPRSSSLTPQKQRSPFSRFC
jgi:hypothetical protein